MNRREFLIGGGALAAASCAIAANGEGTASKAAVPGKLIISPPVLQNAAETSMGIGFAVSALANGYVDVSESPDMGNARRVKCGGFRVTDMNDKIMLVRLTGLKPGTRYYYRIGADRIEYKDGYHMRIVNSESDARIYSFTTLGQGGDGSFCVINDTHAQFKPFGACVDKVAELKPNCVVWNGDACNTQETIDSLLPIFFTPPVERVAYAAEIPYMFVPGNHDNRGRAARQMERVWMFRQPEERSSRHWDLGRNFAVRNGDIAMIGLDTGEDKLDGRDIFAGLFNMEPYRVAQTEWLRETLERPEIKSAPFIVAFCHIPLHDDRPDANPGDVDKDGGGKYSRDFAVWQRTCANMWGPLLERAGCQLVITAHQHHYRYDAPTATRKWAHLVGGGCRFEADTPNFPTVIDGRTSGGKLKVTVNNVVNNTVVGEFTFPPRSR